MAALKLGAHTGQQDIELDELRRLWQHCDASGFDLITVWDHVQKPIPITIGGGDEQRTLAIAAARGHGSNITYAPPEVFRRKMEVLDEWCERYHRDPKTVDRSVQLHFYMSSKGAAPGVQRDGSLWGEPQQVIDRMGEYVDAGAPGINVAIRPPVDWDALQSYIEDVMPAFRVEEVAPDRSAFVPV